MIDRGLVVANAFLQTPRSLFHGASHNGALSSDPMVVQEIHSTMVEAAFRRDADDGILFTGHTWRSGGGCFIVTDGKVRLAAYFTPIQEV